MHFGQQLWSISGGQVTFLNCTTGYRHNCGRDTEASQRELLWFILTAGGCIGDIIQDSGGRVWYIQADAEA